jgi:1-acyl-sn-glycerol-3-phosphate acyltransferase
VNAEAERVAPVVPPPTWFARFFYQFLRVAMVGFTKLFWRVEVRGREHVPRTGPFILSPVHRSNIDTPIVAHVTRRRMRYMGKEEMWKYRWSAWFFTAAGGFPVHRGTADRDALRMCRAVLAAGQPLVMFPEGTRQSGPVVAELFDGPAYVACQSGAPIVPVGIGGSERAMPKGAKFIRPVKLVLTVGPPIEPPPSVGGRVSRRVVRELSEQLRKELQRLFDEAQALAGTPNP